jgi:hypothetical protein
MSGSPGDCMDIQFLAPGALDLHDSSPDLPRTEPQTIRVELKTIFFKSESSLNEAGNHSN